ncbi:hypothetical protein BJ165DRAFT_562984 [Panaeolus papilionaceus]|nr:hypothetical protein BJ165DRAFT_562984 [Panaeolus papilionaceus]
MTDNRKRDGSSTSALFPLCASLPLTVTITKSCALDDGVSLSYPLSLQTETYRIIIDRVKRTRLSSSDRNQRPEGQADSISLRLSTPTNNSHLSSLASLLPLIPLLPSFSPFLRLPSGLTSASTAPTIPIPIPIPIHSDTFHPRPSALSHRPIIGALRGHDTPASSTRCS